MQIAIVLTDADKERFNAKFKRGPRCWKWTAGNRHKFGYGLFRLRKRKTVGAHRVAWTLANGPIPAGKWVLHRCDVPECVRPSHLFLGTAFDNYTDCRMKGRHLHGSRHRDARLTAGKVRTIHARAARGEPRAALARQYGVSHQTIDKICSARRWRHLNLPALPKPGYWRGPRK